MERTSPSSSTQVKMTTGGTKSDNTNGSAASIVTNTQLGELSSTSSSHLSSSSSLSGTIAKKSPTNNHSTNNKTTTHVEYLTKLIQRVDEREAATATDTNSSLSDHSLSSYASSDNSSRNRKPCSSESLDSSTIAFNKLEICDTNKCVTETSCKGDSSKNETVDVVISQQQLNNKKPLYEPISKKLNNMQRIKGIEYTLSNKHNTSPNNDHSLTTKCDNNVTCITSLPPHIKILPKTQSLDIVDDDDASASRIVVNNNRMSNVNVVVHNNSSVVANDGTLEMKGTIPRLQAGDQSRPIYPSLNFSPYASPFSSPRTGRRRAPLRESRRVSIEQNGSFLFLNQYKLMDEIGQVSEKLQFLTLN